MSPVDSPTAPAANASSANRHISSRAPSANSGAIPLAVRRSALWPTRQAMWLVGPARSTRSRYPSKVPGTMSAPMASSEKPRVDSAAAATENGANENPQLPTISVVTPCMSLNGWGSSMSGTMSECACGSMKPGVTARPVASIVRRAGPRSRPMATTRSPSMATSASRLADPKPSNTSPPVITRSCIASLS